MAPNKKKIERFSERNFSLRQIAELIDIPRTTIIDKLPKIGVKTNAEGSSKSKLSWEDFGKIANFYRSEITKKAPKDKCKAAVNQKGGVGKTTLIQQLAMEYALQGLRVLLWDNDPQGHSTFFFGFPNTSGAGPTLKNVYKKEVSFSDLIISICPTLDLVPSNPDLSEIELELMMDLSGHKRMKKIVDHIYDGYDVILIDNNPAFTRVTFNAMCAADELCFICETALYSVNGMKGLFEVLEKLEESDPNFGPRLRIIPNKFTVGENDSQNGLSHLRSSYADLVTNTVVHACADFKNATNSGSAVVLPPYKQSKAAHDIKYLAKELLIDADQDDETTLDIPAPKLKGKPNQSNLNA